MRYRESRRTPGQPDGRANCQVLVSTSIKLLSRRYRPGLFAIMIIDRFVIDHDAKSTGLLHLLSKWRNKLTLFLAMTRKHWKMFFSHKYYSFVTKETTIDDDRGTRYWCPDSTFFHTKNVIYFTTIVRIAWRNRIGERR